MTHEARQDDKAVNALMWTLAQLPLPPDQSPVDPRLIWWKANIVRQLQSEQAAARVLERGSALTILLGALLCLIVALFLASRDGWNGGPTALLPLALTFLGFLVAGIVAARSVWNLSIQRRRAVDQSLVGFH